MDIFSLSGPQFLQLFLAVEVVAIPASMVARAVVLHNHNRRETSPDRQLSGYDAAFLNGGGKHAFLTAVATLSGDKCIEISDDSLVLLRHPTHQSDPLEKRICGAISSGGSKIEKVMKDMNSEFQVIEAKLRQAELVPSPAREVLARLFTGGILLAPVLLLGPQKMFVGLAGHHPVGYLAMFSLVALAIAVFGFVVKPQRTSRGDEALEKWRFDHSALKVNLGFLQSLSRNDKVLAYALFGGVALSALDPFSSARTALDRRSWAQFGCGSSCGGSCGGGGCGGGCGGCGG